MSGEAGMECQRLASYAMAQLADVDWPPPPIVTPRLILRETNARDRDGYLELLTSGDVRRYLGGPLPRDDVALAMAEVPGRYPGVFAVEINGEFAGGVCLERRDAERPGHLREGGGELEISFTLLPEYWGHGYAHEAAEAVLAWAGVAFPDERMVLCTQTANARARRLADRLGFREVARFKEFDAEQWLGVR